MNDQNKNRYRRVTPKKVTAAWCVERDNAERWCYVPSKRRARVRIRARKKQKVRRSKAAQEVCDG